MSFQSLACHLGVLSQRPLLFTANLTLSLPVSLLDRAWVSDDIVPWLLTQVPVTLPHNEEQMLCQGYLRPSQETFYSPPWLS